MMLRLYERYFARQIYGVFFFILLAFVGLFFFFDLLSELGSVNGGYTTWVAMLRVALLTPSRFYEIIPIATLIGAIYVLSQLAGNSEFTILRVAGLDRGRVLLTMMKIGLPVVLLTYAIGEYVGPHAQQESERLRLKALGSAVYSGFRSGVWVRDRQPVAGTDLTLSRFVNVGALLPDQTIVGVRIYEFDDDLRLRAIRVAESGRYDAPGHWLLQNVTETQFIETAPAAADDGELASELQSRQVSTSSLRMRSELTPQILSSLMLQADNMAIRDLFRYIRHLRDNQQDAQRYEIAFWKRLVYPLTVLVMLVLAVPFGYLHARSGAVSIKVFGGIMLGMSFVLVNTLFSHVGLLNAWPAVFTAIAPGSLYLAIGIASLLWMEKH